MLNIVSEHCFLSFYRVSYYMAAQPHNKNPVKCACLCGTAKRGDQHPGFGVLVTYDTLAQPNQMQERYTGAVLKCVSAGFGDLI